MWPVYFMSVLSRMAVQTAYSTIDHTTPSMTPYNGDMSPFATNHIAPKGRKCAAARPDAPLRTGICRRVTPREMAIAAAELRVATETKTDTIAVDAANTIRDTNMAKKLVVVCVVLVLFALVVAYGVISGGLFVR